MENKQILIDDDNNLNLVLKKYFNECGVDPSAPSDAKKIIKLVDENMHKAKNTGKNRVNYDKN